MTRSGFAAVLTAVLTLASFAAAAQSFRCAGKDNKKYYGSMIPPECIGRPVEQLNNRGMVIKRIDPQGEEKARQAKEATLAQKRKDEAAAKEAARRNHALLATYTSEKDIDEARNRALADNQKALQEIRDPHRGHQKAPGRLREGARLLQRRQQGSGEADRRPPGRGDRPQGA